MPIKRIAELLADKNKGKASHGYGSRFARPLEKKLHSTWSGMKGRCNNPNSDDYSNYGGRGISVCPEWNNDIEAFAQAAGLPPTLDHSIDRIDVNKGYEPGNVRWATIKQQSRNRRTNRHIHASDGIQCVTEAAEELGVNESVLRRRLDRGWSEKDTIEKPVDSRRGNFGERLFTVDGITRNAKQTAQHLGINYSTFRFRINRGESVDQIIANPPKKMNRVKTKNRMLTVDGETKTLQQWATISQIPASTLHMRIHKGWTHERAVKTPLLRQIQHT